MTTLDSEIRDRAFTLCKMDVEGAEWSALKGASSSLARATPAVWLIELSEKSLARSSASVRDVEEWLDDMGYSLWRYQDNELIPFVSADRKPGHVGDGIAIANNQLAEVQLRLSNNV